MGCLHFLHTGAFLCLCVPCSPLFSVKVAAKMQDIENMHDFDVLYQVSFNLNLQLSL